MNKKIITDMLNIQLADYKAEQYKHTINTKEYNYYKGKINAILDIIDRVRILYWE